MEAGPQGGTGNSAASRIRKGENHASGFAFESASFSGRLIFLAAPERDNHFVEKELST